MRMRSLHKWSWRANEPFKQSRSIIMLYLAFSILRKISRRCAKYTRARSRPPSVCATISIDDNSIYTSNKEAEALHSAQDGDNKSVWTNADIRVAASSSRSAAIRWKERNRCQIPPRSSSSVYDVIAEWNENIQSTGSTGSRNIGCPRKIYGRYAQGTAIKILLWSDNILPCFPPHFNSLPPSLSLSR